MRGFLKFAKWSAIVVGGLTLASVLASVVVVALTGTDAPANDAKAKAAQFAPERTASLIRDNLKTKPATARLAKAAAITCTDVTATEQHCMIEHDGRVDEVKATLHLAEGTISIDPVS